MCRIMRQCSDCGCCTSRHALLSSRHFPPPTSNSVISTSYQYADTAELLFLPRIGGGIGTPHIDNCASDLKLQMEDWTGIGDEDLPQHVHMACKAAQIVPSYIHGFFIPKAELCVTGLLSAHPTPPLASSPIIESAPWCYYSMELPNVKIDPMPPGLALTLAQYRPNLI